MWETIGKKLMVVLLVTELRVVGVGHGPTQGKKKNLNVDDMLDEVVT
jgi:hypothetical protein